MSRKARIFFLEFNIRFYDKNSESDYYFFPPPKSEYFFQQHWESEYFLEKEKNIPPPPPPPPPLQVKWSVPKDQCKENKFNVPKHREIVSDILDSFNYLGSCIITEGGAERDIKVRIGKARSVLD